ncbi:carbon monoxide dehydrogenase beta subunit family protein [Methanopyrus sp.]
MPLPKDPTLIYTDKAEVARAPVLKMVLRRANDPMMIVGPRAVKDGEWRELLVKLCEEFRMNAVCTAPYGGKDLGRKMGIVEVATLLQRDAPVLGVHPDLIVFTGSRTDVTDRVLQGLRHARPDLVKVSLNPEYCPSADYSLPTMKREQFLRELEALAGA